MMRYILEAMNTKRGAKTSFSLHMIDAPPRSSVSTGSMLCGHLTSSTRFLNPQGKLALDKRPFLVRDVINTAVSQVVVAAHEKQLETLVDIDPDALNLSFVSDSSRITQILSNFGWNSCKVRNSSRRFWPPRRLSLLAAASFVERASRRPSPENAARLPPLFLLPQFTTEGSVTFRMRLLSVRKNERTLEPESAVVRFEVEDTGPGVDPAMQKVLFQPYEMGVFSRVGKYGGSGLGLNICKALAGAFGAGQGPCNRRPLDSHSQSRRQL